MLVMCQCLFITSLVIDNKRLQVTEKGIMSARIGLQIFKNVKTVNSADLVVDVVFFVNFLHIPS